MFPITDVRNRVIAFGGRALEKDVPAKYLNSPETPLFHKGDNLYNLATARQATHNGAPLIVVEGYVDVIAMVTTGFAASVAPLGTALTENQLALLWKMADEPILCFDGDKAGTEGGVARRRSGAAASQARKEPALCAAARRAGPRRSRALRRPRRDRGSDVAARGLADMIWSREIEGGSFATPERRAALEARIGELANGIRDEVVRRYYRQDLAERLQRTFAPEGGRGGYGRGNYGRGNFGGRGSESGRRFAPRGSFTPGPAGRFAPGAGRPAAPARPSTAAPTRRPVPSWPTARSCAASAARCRAARR